jgi:hypothetical protein
MRFPPVLSAPCGSDPASRVRAARPPAGPSVHLRNEDGSRIRLMFLALRSTAGMSRRRFHGCRRRARGANGSAMGKRQALTKATPRSRGGLEGGDDILSRVEAAIAQSQITRSHTREIAGCERLRHETTESDIMRRAEIMLVECETQLRRARDILSKRFAPWSAPPGGHG